MKCDIIIPVWNQLEHTKTCIDHILKNTRYPYRLILIDNASEARTKSYLESIAGASKGSPEITLIRNEENTGFVKAVNQGLKVSDSPYVCVMNNDTIPAPRWLEIMVRFAESHPEIGIVNPQCNREPSIPFEEHAKALEANGDKYMEMNQCFLFCALIKREVIKRIGYLDEAFGMGCYDDTDYSMRAGLAGYRCVSLHSSYVHHTEHVSFRALGDMKKVVAECERKFLEKWPRHLRVGAAFSVNAATRDVAVENFLKGVLFLAREWCWMNLWIFGDEPAAKERIARVGARIGMPLHQNIKYNYLPASGKRAQVLVRVLERSFGTKARKQYDAVIVADERLFRFLNIFRVIHGVNIYLLKSYEAMEEGLRAALSAARHRR